MQRRPDGLISDADSVETDVVSHVIGIITVVEGEHDPREVPDTFTLVGGVKSDVSDLTGVHQLSGRARPAADPGQRRTSESVELHHRRERATNPGGQRVAARK